jgi:hypothetical protein
MPGFYPSQPESADNAADAALRDRARKLADDIELVGARVRVLANNSPSAGLSWAADRMNGTVRSLRPPRRQIPPRPASGALALPCHGPRCVGARTARRWRHGPIQGSRRVV